ncbi:DNA polymerase Y family protein [Cryobacterium sp. HLT2-28]|nr:DNA polymerase Y family protein [Cryobacterium sp. HLT2-28]
MSSPSRTIVLWCPDWPVAAARAETGLPRDAPLALISQGTVFASSASARADGVRRGLTLREAQYRCGTLVALPHDPRLDERAFEPVLARLEEVAPGVATIRPGTGAVRARGPARYYGGEEPAGQSMRDAVLDLGVADARVGIADGPFAAEQAARSAQRAEVRAVPPGHSSGFLAGMPVALVVDARLTMLLRRLGVHTLGDLAALPAAQVAQRFGPAGLAAQAQARGVDPAPLPARVPPPQRDLLLRFEPPLDRIDQVAFAARAPADSFVDGLAGAHLVCTTLRVEVGLDSGRMLGRSWRHPRWFDAADVVDRVRWQLQGSGAGDPGLDSAVCWLRILPEEVDGAGNHEPGLWGSGPDERIHHALSRVQSLLGHEGVVTAVVGGGRLLAERQVFVPWGDAPAGPRAGPAGAAAAPWPGSLAGPLPATVFRERRPVGLLTQDGSQVDVDERGLLPADPVQFSPSGQKDDLRSVAAWAGPWPVHEGWWRPGGGRRVDRVQIVDADGAAWLLHFDDRRWWAEAHYD